MHTEKGIAENGEEKFHISRAVTSRLQRWSERAISHVKAVKEQETNDVHVKEKVKKSPEKLLPQTNQIKDLESALTELVNVHINSSPIRERNLEEVEPQSNGDVENIAVQNQNTSEQNKRENKTNQNRSKTDNNDEDDKVKSQNINNNTARSEAARNNNVSSDNVPTKTNSMLATQIGNSQSILKQGTRSPKVNKRLQTGKMAGKLASNETKSAEVLPITEKCDHDETQCCNQGHCSSVNKNTRLKQVNEEYAMKSQDDSAASQRKVLKRPILRKNKSEGDVLKQRVQMSLAGLDFKDADISAFAAECLKAADMKQQQKKDSKGDSGDYIAPNGTTSPVSIKQKQRQLRKTSKGEATEMTRGSPSPPNSQNATPRRRSVEYGNPSGRTIHKVCEHEELSDCTAKDYGQRQLQLATKKLEKLIRKTETIQEITAGEKREQKSTGERKLSTDFVSSLSKSLELDATSNKEEQCGLQMPKVPGKLAMEELKSERFEVRSTEPKSRKASRDDIKEFEKKSTSRKNSSQESEITLRSYKSLAKESFYSVEDKKQDTVESGKKSLERLEMLRHDLNCKPKPKLNKFPSLPLFYTPSGMENSYSADKLEEAVCSEGDSSLGGINKLVGSSQDVKIVGSSKFFIDDMATVYKNQLSNEPRNIGSSYFYTQQEQEQDIVLSEGTKSGLSTFYTQNITETSSATQS